jgi:hypothetical protein
VTGTAGAIAAQVGAEVRMRLRSTATLVAFLAIAAGTYFWLPSARGKAVSMTWKTASGKLVAPLYTSGAIGVAVTVFAGVFLTLAGFYLVVGSIRRDRERGVGAILAATPLSNAAYLTGKFVANLAYLAVLALLMLGVGAVRFALEGVGAFQPAALALPVLLMAGPALVFVAAMAVFFDVTPVLRDRLGLVAWFFTFLFVVASATVPRHAENGRLRAALVPPFDPSGAATLQQLVVESVPDARKDSLGTGHIVLDQAPERVAWKGIRITPRIAAGRLMNLLWGAPPLLAALLLFDRFDPARRRLRRRRGKARRDAVPIALPESGFEARPSALPPAHPRPSVLASTAAEALLVWQSAPLAKWLLLAASLVSLALPASALMGIAAVWLVLLVPVISEAGAREDLSGAGGLVFSQPGVPISASLWKAGSLALFLLATGAPLALRFTMISAARGIAWTTGLLFLAGFAAGAARLTGGGKLFSAVLLCLWYAAVSGAPDFDFCGITGGATGPAMRALYLGIGAAFLGTAMLKERRAA